MLSTLGIDVSKNTLVCALLDSTTRKVTWEAEFPNAASGVEALLEK